MRFCINMYVCEGLFRCMFVEKEVRNRITVFGTENGIGKPNLNLISSRL